MARLPITILTGYLGSGKTALLGQWLAQPDWRDTAVVVNEVGEAPLDHGLLRRGSEAVEALSAGCLCCGVRGELLETLHRLLVQRQRGEIAWFDRLVMETSGLADPAALAAALMADGFLAEASRIERLVACLDALDGPQRLADSPEAERQLAVADSIVVTKADLAEAPQLRAAREAARAANPAAAQATSPPAATAARTALAPVAAPRASDPEAPTGHVHGDTAVLTRRVAAPLPRARVEAAFSALLAAGTGLVRVKAALPVAEHPGRVAVLQAVGHRAFPVAWHAAGELPPESQGAVMVACRPRSRASVDSALAQLAPEPAEAP